MTLYFNGHVTLDTSNGPTQVKIVDGRIVKPEPVELDDPPSDAPWLVADDAININTAARRPTDPDVDVVGQVASAAMGFPEGAVRAAVHSAKLVADERKRVEASMVDEPKVTYPRLAPDWRSLVPEGWGPSGVKMDTGEPVYRVFASHQQWVNKASGWMGSCDECVDSSGRVLRIGSDFERATWPVAIIRPVASGSPARPYDAVNIDLGAIAAALAPGEALDLAGIIARAAAYRRHSIELAAIRAAVDPTVHTEVAGLVPFPWDAVEVGDPHDRVCVLVDAMNKAADALAKVRAS